MNLRMILLQGLIWSSSIIYSMDKSNPSIALKNRSSKRIVIGREWKEFFDYLRHNNLTADIVFADATSVPAKPIEIEPELKIACAIALTVKDSASLSKDAQ